MSRDQRWIHGSTISKDGELRFASVSSIDMADTAAEGCPRKYAYRYVEKIKPPENDKQARGIAGHSCVETYLRTASTAAISSDVAPGMHMIPEPGPDLLVEWDILLRPGVQYPALLTEAHSPALLTEAPVKLAGVPLLGYIDCIHARGTNKGGAEIDDTIDPADTVEVIDWKFVGGTRFLKTRAELAKTTQLVSYAAWAWAVRPQTDRVRISLGYFPAKGASRKVSRLITREDARPQIEHASGVVRILQHVAKEPDASHVEGNTSACDKYGGCYYKKTGRCDVPMRKSLEMLVGKTMADEVYAPPPARNTPPTAPVIPQQERIIPVSSLFNRTPSGVQSSVQANPASSSSQMEASVAVERARIAADEAKAKLSARVPAGFVEACASVRSYNKGFPTLLGAAAMAYAASGGQDVAEGTKFPGTGDISFVELDEPGLMTALAEDLRVDSEANPAPILPPDAPASDPSKAANVAPKAEETKAEAPAPKKRAKKEPAPLPTNAEEAAGLNDAIHVYVDCATTVQTQNLDAWAQSLADAIAKSAGLLDIRLGESEGLGFGKWPGVLMAMTRDPARSPLPGGHYTISTGSPILKTVAEGLEIRARDSGGSFTRGVK